MRSAMSFTCCMCPRRKLKQPQSGISTSPRHGSDQVIMMARSVFHDMFPAEEAAELEMRAKLLAGINKWLKKSELTQAEAAEHLGITQARVAPLHASKPRCHSRILARDRLEPRDANCLTTSRQLFENSERSRAMSCFITAAPPG